MEKTTIAATMAVLVAILMVGSVLVPIIDIQSKETTTIMNDVAAAGNLRFNYVEDAEDYDIDIWVEDGSTKVGTQGQAAKDCIIWASDLAAVVANASADSSVEYVLLAQNGTGTDAVTLGTSGNLACADGTVTISDSTDAVVFTSDSIAWQYVPASGGSFGNYGSGYNAVVKDFPMAVAGEFAGVTTYNSLDSLNYGFESTSTVTDGVMYADDWVIPAANDNIISAGYVSGDVVVLKSAAVPTPSYTDGDWGFNLSGSDAVIVSYSGVAGDLVIPSQVSDGSNTYTVKALGIGSSNSPIFDNDTITGSTVTIPSTVTEISSFAFYKCSGFTGDLVIPDSVTTIRSDAFNQCSGFTSLVLSDSLTSLGTRAFYYCSGFTGDLVIPDSLTKISSNAFYGGGFTGDLVIPDSVTTIGTYGFRECEFTGTLFIPDSVTSIEMYAFQDCSGFTSMVVCGSPSLSWGSLPTDVTEVLNLGSTEIVPGSNGLPPSAEVRDYIGARMGYIAPVSFSETVEKSGAEYDLMRILPVMVIAGIVMASAVMFGLMRRND